MAAGCAAVLTVYAAGYWRTRDVERLLETQAQERRPARAHAKVPVPAVSASVPAIEAPAPAQAPKPPAASVTAAAAPATMPAEAPAAPPVEQAPKVAKDAAPASITASSSAPTAAVAKPAAAPAVAPVVASTVAPVVGKASEVPAVPVEDKPGATSAVAVPPGPLPAGSVVWRDGIYTGWGSSRHGDIQAQVTIEGGRIVNSGIVTCNTRYPCDVIAAIVFQPVKLQGPDVDQVSRATESSDAYYYALVEALKSAQVPAEAPADPAATPK